MNKEYLFTSERLGFRNWEDADFTGMYELNQSPAVMEFFPALPDREQTKDFIARMQTLFEAEGYCYFATDLKTTGEFLGFIGICKQTYEADFTPCVDIGWRLKESAWGKGYATEGAKANLRYAFETLQLKALYSIASVVNVKSIAVMKKIGMQAVKTFDHPALLENEFLKTCWLYQIKNPIDVSS